MGKVIYKNLVRTSDNDDVLFVLDQHAQLDLKSAISLKQQSTGRHVNTFRQISQPVSSLTT